MPCVYICVCAYVQTGEKLMTASTTTSLSLLGLARQHPRSLHKSIPPALALRHTAYYVHMRELRVTCRGLLVAYRHWMYP